LAYAGSLEDPGHALDRAGQSLRQMNVLSGPHPSTIPDDAMVLPMLPAGPSPSPVGPATARR